MAARKFEITHVVGTVALIISLFDNAGFSCYPVRMCLCASRRDLLGSWGRFSRQADVFGGCSYPVLPEGVCNSNTLRVLLEIPAEWLFQSLFPSHHGHSLDGLCCRQKGKEWWWFWGVGGKIGGACIPHNQMSAETCIFFSAKIKKILMVLEGILYLQFWRILNCYEDGSLFPPIIKKVLFPHWFKMPYLSYTVIRLSFLSPTHPSIYPSYSSSAIWITDMANLWLTCNLSKGKNNNILIAFIYLDFFLEVIYQSIIQLVLTDSCPPCPSEKSAALVWILDVWSFCFFIQSLVL